MSAVASEATPRVEEHGAEEGEHNSPAPQRAKDSRSQQQPTTVAAPGPLDPQTTAEHFEGGSSVTATGAADLQDRSRPPPLFDMDASVEMGLTEPQVQSIGASRSDVESAAWLEDEASALAVASFLPTFDLVVSFAGISSDSLKACQDAVKERHTQNSVRYRTAKVLHLVDSIVTVFNGPTTKGSLFLRETGPLSTGYLAQGVVMGPMADDMISFGQKSGPGLVKRLEGTFCLAPPKRTKRKDAHSKKPVVVLTPQLFDVTATLSNGTVCRLNNCLTVEGTQIWEITCLFPTTNSGCDSTVKAGATTTVEAEGAQSFLRGEVEQAVHFKAGYACNPNILGKGTAPKICIQKLCSVDQSSSTDQDEEEGGVDISILLDGSAATSGTLTGIPLQTSLQELRLRIKTQMKDVLLPDRYSFKRYTKTSTENDSVDTVADILPWNRGQFLQFELPSPFLPTTTCGWPAGVRMRHNRVLAAVIRPLNDQEPADGVEFPTNAFASLSQNPMSPLAASTNTPLPTSGVHRAKAIKEQSQGRQSTLSQQSPTANRSSSMGRNLPQDRSTSVAGGTGAALPGSPINLQVKMVDLLSSAIECARIGSVDGLRNLLEGGGVASAGLGMQTPMSGSMSVGGGSTSKNAKGRQLNAQSLLARTAPISPSTTTPMGFSLLHVAVEYGQAKCVALLVDSGATVLCRTPAGQLPLHLAALRGHADCFPPLLRAPGGIDTLNAQDSQGKTALHFALEANFTNTALWLVEQGANVHIVDIQGRTACSLASRRLKTVNEAVAANDTKALQLMLISAMSSTVGVDDPEDLLLAPGDVQRELMAMEASDSVMAAMMAQELNPEALDPNDVFLETLRNHLTHGRLLLDLEGSKTVDRKTGRVVDNILKIGALHESVHREAFACFLLLLQCTFVDIQSVDANGDTALHRIATKGLLNFAQVLLALAPLHGVPRSQLLAAKNHKGQTPLHCGLLVHRKKEQGDAADTNRTDLLNLFLDQIDKDRIHSILRSADNDGQTPAHFAVQFLSYDQPLALKCWMLARQQEAEATTVFDGSHSPGSLVLAATPNAEQSATRRRTLADYYAARKQGDLGETPAEKPKVASTLFSTAVARRSIGAINELISFLGAPNNRDFDALLGTIDDRLLLQAFHGGQIQMFQRLLNALSAGLQALEGVSLAKARVVRHRVVISATCESPKMEPHRQYEAFGEGRKAKKKKAANAPRARKTVEFKEETETLAAYIMTHCLEQQWVDLLMRDHEVRRALWVDACSADDATSQSQQEGGILHDLITRLMEWGEFSKEPMTKTRTHSSHKPMSRSLQSGGGSRAQSPGNSTPVSIGGREVSSRRPGRGKGGQHGQPAVVDHKAFPHMQYTRLHNSLEVVLGSFSSAATEEEERSHLRRLLLKQAMRCHKHERVFACLITFIGGRHTFSNAECDSLLQLAVCRTLLYGADVKQDLSSKVMDALSSMAGNNSATPSVGHGSVLGGQSQLGAQSLHRGAGGSLIGARSVAPSIRGSHGPPSMRGLPLSTKSRSLGRLSHRSHQGDGGFGGGAGTAAPTVAVSLAGPLTHPYDSNLLTVERNLCQLMPHLVLEDPSLFLLELVEKRHFASALSFVSGETFDRSCNLYKLSTKTGKSALHIACDNAATNLVLALLATSDFVLNDPSGEHLYPIHYACRKGDLKCVQALLTAGDDPARVATRYPDPKNERSLGVTPLHFAAQAGAQDVARALLQKCTVQVEARNVYEQTPLHYACIAGQEGTAVLLVDHGAKVERQDKQGRNALMHAVRGRHESLVLKLIQRSKKEHLLLCYNPDTGRSLASHSAWYGLETLLERVIMADKAAVKAYKDKQDTINNEAPTREALKRRRSTVGGGNLGLGGFGPSSPANGSAAATESPLNAILGSGGHSPLLQKVLGVKGGGDVVTSVHQDPLSASTATVAPPVDKPVLPSRWLVDSSLPAKQSGGLSHMQTALDIPGDAVAVAVATVNGTAGSLETSFASFRGASLKVEDGGPLGALDSLFSASKKQRNDRGDTESLQSLNVLRNSVKAMRDDELARERRENHAGGDGDNENADDESRGNDTGTTAKKEEADENSTAISDGSRSLMSFEDLRSAYPWTPAHYAIANGNTKVCTILEKWGIPRPSVNMQRNRFKKAAEAAVLAAHMAAKMRARCVSSLRKSQGWRSQKSEEASDSSDEDENDLRSEAMPDPILFPEVSTSNPDTLKRRAIEVENIIFARPPPPPPPEPRWWDGYYGLGGVLGLFKKTESTGATCNWNFKAATSDALFDSRVLETLRFWCHNGMAENTEHLLPLLSSVDAPVDEAGTTLLMHAAYWNQAEVVKVLLKAGANINHTVRLCQQGFVGGITALGLACMTCATEVIDILLANEADNDITDECGNTALHHVVARRNFKLTKILLHSLCSIDKKNHCGELPEDIAVQQRDNNIRRLLRWWGESNNVKSGVARPPCTTSVSLEPWLKAAALYYQRLDLLHRKYISLSNQDEAHSVPCLLYARVCKLMGYGVQPARSVLNQMYSFWWPEEVREIGLSGIYLGHQGLSTLLHFIKVLPRLEVLDLSGNRLTHELVVELLRCCTNHPGLRKIVLKNNKDITKISALKIIDFVKKNTQIVTFDVHDTGMEVSQQAVIHRHADDNKRRAALVYQDLSALAAKPSSPARSQSPQSATGGSPTKDGAASAADGSPGAKRHSGKHRQHLAKSRDVESAQRGGDSKMLRTV